jgi:hypothetical protein
MIENREFDSHSLRHLHDFVRQPAIAIARYVDAVGPAGRFYFTRDLEKVATAHSVISSAPSLRSCESRLCGKANTHKLPTSATWHRFGGGVHAPEFVDRSFYIVLLAECSFLFDNADRQDRLVTRGWHAWNNGQHEE